MEIEGKQHKYNKGAPDTDHCFLDKYTMKAAATADQPWRKIQKQTVFIYILYDNEIHPAKLCVEIDPPVIIIWL